MKSYFLTQLESKGRAEDALCTLLPGQSNPWVLRSTAGDAVAYLNIQAMGQGSTLWEIQADLSGRHYHRDDEVLKLLGALQSQTGGEIEHDV